MYSKSDLERLERLVGYVSDAADGLRSASASEYPDAVADAFDSVHSALEDVCGLFAELLPDDDAG